MRQLEDIQQTCARAEIIRIMRTVTEYKQHELSSTFGVSESFITQMEKARKKVNDEILEKYLVFFGVDRKSFDEVEKKAIEIIFGKKDKKLKLVLIVVEMMLNSKQD